MIVFIKNLDLTKKGNPSSLTHQVPGRPIIWIITEHCSRRRWGLFRHFFSRLSFPFLSPSGWLVGCFGFNGPLRQYFSLYRTVSQREGERRETEFFFLFYPLTLEGRRGTTDEFTTIPFHLDLGVVGWCDGPW